MKLIYSLFHLYLPLPGYITNQFNDQFSVGLLLGSISKSAAPVSLMVRVGMAKCLKTSIISSFFSQQYQLRLKLR